MSWLSFFLCKSSESGIKNDLFPADPSNIKSWIFEKPSLKKPKTQTFHHRGNWGARAGMGTGVVTLHILCDQKKLPDWSGPGQKKRRPTKSSCASELPQTNAITSFNDITQWSHSSSRLRGLCPVLAEALQGDVGVLAAQGGSQHASAVPGCRPGLGHPPSRQKTSHGLRFIIIRLEKFRCSHENSHRTGGSCLYRFKLIQHPIPNTELKQHRESSPTGHGENMETQEKICQNPKWKSKFTNRMQKKTYWYCRGKIW